MKDEYNLKKLFDLMIRKLWIIALAAIVCGGVAFYYASYHVPLKYQSYASIYVKNTEKQESSGVSANDLNTSRSMADTVIVILQEDGVMEAVGEKLLQVYSEETVSEIFPVSDGKISPSLLRSCISLTSLNKTEVVRITAVTTSAEMSAALCNIIAEVAPDYLFDDKLEGGSFKVITPARVFPTPVSPNVSKYTMIGFAAGAILVMLIIFLIDLFDNSVKDSDELNKKYEKAILGEINEMHTDKSKGKKSKNQNIYMLLTDKKMPFYITESYKTMRNNLIFSLSTAKQKVFAVSSATPGEGKSTTSANIAITLAQLGSRVILIDGDMRKPVQHVIFRLKNKTGLSSAICNLNKLEECISKTGIENLDVMTAGPKPPNPSELLSSDQAAQIFRTLSDTYDYVIIDTPPTNVVSDAMCISESVAGCIFVLKYAATTYNDVDAALKNMELANMKLLGFVINDVRKAHNSASYYHYRKGYSDYYGYGSGTGSSSNGEKA